MFTNVYFKVWIEENFEQDPIAGRELSDLTVNCLSDHLSWSGLPFSQLPVMKLWHGLTRGRDLCRLGLHRRGSHSCSYIATGESTLTSLDSCWDMPPALGPETYNWYQLLYQMHRKLGLKTQWSCAKGKSQGGTELWDFPEPNTINSLESKGIWRSTQLVRWETFTHDLKAGN